VSPAISGSTTRSSTLQARPGASLFVDTLIPPMRACALLVERRSASRGQHFCRRGVQMQLQTAPPSLHSAPSWRWPPHWRTSPASSWASCATSARSSRPPPVPSAPRVAARSRTRRATSARSSRPSPAPPVARSASARCRARCAVSAVPSRTPPAPPQGGRGVWQRSCCHSSPPGHS
jgi:hypothetical protein